MTYQQRYGDTPEEFEGAEAESATEEAEYISAVEKDDGYSAINEDATAERGEEGDDAEESGEAEEIAEPEAGCETENSLPLLPLASVVEAVLFAAREPLKIQNIARAAGKGTRGDAIREAVAELNLQYLESGRSFEIAEIAGRYQLMSRPEYAPHISRLYPKGSEEAAKASRLTPSALETLAIIAYKQPATRAEIERIRGCSCGPALRGLIERGSVKVAGKRTDLVGQPLLYGTTEAFLAEFGLGSIEELPLRNEFLGFLPGSSLADAASEEEPVRELIVLPEPKEDNPPEESAKSGAQQSDEPDNPEVSMEPGENQPGNPDDTPFTPEAQGHV